MKNPFLNDFLASFAKLTTGKRVPMDDTTKRWFDNYSYPMSEEFQKLFLLILEYLPAVGINYSVQGKVWDYLTNYTAHHRLGERAKMRSKDQDINNIIAYLEYEFDHDPKSIFE